jgi:hypothetical protein
MNCCDNEISIFGTNTSFFGGGGGGAHFGTGLLAQFFFERMVLILG